VTVIDSTHMTVQMTANAGALFQPYSILAITGSEEAVLPNGLSMVAGTGGNLIANSGFELPAQASGQFQYNPTDPTGSWKFTSLSGVSQNGSGFTSNNNAAPDGNQVGLIQGTGSISQLVGDFVPGTSYALTFAASGRVGYAPQMVDIQIANADGSGAEDLGVYSFGTTDPAYYVYTSPAFTRIGGTARLTITGLVPKGTLDATVFLDSVQIVPVP
jgi:hypothetical protein